MTYNKDEVFNNTMKYFDNDELATNIWIDKYCLKINNEYYELNPDDMHKRLAKQFFKIESKYNNKYDLSYHSKYGKNRKNLSEEDIYQLFKNFKYIIPQGSVMSQLGNTFNFGSLSNCIVLPKLYDSYGGIMYADQQLVQLMKRRAGVGLDISTLRPVGTLVTNAAKTSTGAVSFMERFSNTTREVAQNNRRGALMITIDINHPDIEYFIDIKKDLNKVTGANISIKISDEFMNAVENDMEFELKFPTNSVNPIISKKIMAKELWKKIIKNARDIAEPGLIFWTRQHNYSTSSVYKQYENISTNPCAEIAMGNDSCRLIAINLFSFVDNPYTESAKFDYDKWYSVVYEAQRLNDDLVDLELESIEKILNKIYNDSEPDYIKSVEVETWKKLYDIGKKGRRTGLGITGLGDMLAGLNVKYDSDIALTIVDSVMKLKCEAEFDSSIDMGIERGVFDGFDSKIEDSSLFVQMLKIELPDLYNRMMKFGRRNVSISTIAPTGSLSNLTQTTSGIEPVFMMTYKRRKKINIEDKNDNISIDFIDNIGDTWKEFEVFHPKLHLWKLITNNDDIMKSPYYGCEAHNIDWNKRIKLQAVCQKYVTHSISSTINLKNDVDEKTVSDIYFEAWKNKLKGITIYRDGSRSGVLISKDNTSNNLFFGDNNAPKRPKSLECDVIRFTNNNEKWMSFVGLYKNGGNIYRPYEIFTGLAEDILIPNYVIRGEIIKVKIDNKSRYDFSYTDRHGYKITIEGLNRTFNENYWNYAKLISGLLRHKMPLVKLVDLIESLKLDSDLINTWKNGIKRTLKKYIEDGVKLDKICPICKQETLSYENGCLICKNCGDSKCN